VHQEVALAAWVSARAQNRCTAFACAALALPAGIHARGSGGEGEQRRSSHFVLQRDAVTQERGGPTARAASVAAADQLERAYDELGHWSRCARSAGSR
jgi:hypothetical protein